MHLSAGELKQKPVIISAANVVINMFQLTKLLSGHHTWEQQNTWNVQNAVKKAGRRKCWNKNSGKTKDGKVKGDMIISEDGGMFKFREIQ